MRHALIIRGEEERHLLKQRSVLLKEIEAVSTLVEDNKEVMALYDEIQKHYEKLEQIINEEDLRNIPITKDKHELVESITAKRKDLIDYIKKESQKLFLMLSQYTIKEDCSNAIVWLNYRQSAIIFIDLNRSLSYLQMETPPEIKCTTSKYIGGPSLIKINTDIYFLGGYTGEESLNTLFRMPIRDKNKGLIKLESMKVARHDIAAAQLLKKYLYAITGSVIADNYEVHTKKCEVYDMGKNQWRGIHPVNVGSGVSGVCTFNDRYIFIFGGQINRFSYANRIESYDTLDDEHGWVIHKVTESIANSVSCMDIAAHQISTNEILIMCHEGLQIIKLPQEAIVESKSIKDNHEGLYYPIIQLHRGKVFWTGSSHLFCYDIIKKASLHRSLIF